MSPMTAIRRQGHHFVVVPTQRAEPHGAVWAPTWYERLPAGAWFALLWVGVTLMLAAVWMVAR